VIWWGPIPATQMLIPVLLMIALVALGVHVLRVQTAQEFPDASRGDTTSSLQSGAQRTWQRVRGARDAVATRRELPAHADGARLDELERLAGLHDRGALTDEEFNAAKTSILAGGADR
jgi:hypothetical protein